MLEMGQDAGHGEHVKDITEATFMEDVIEASKEVPVIVDFWAPWCGPCRQLGPALEEAVGAMNGAVKMVKVNVDENQGIAGQLRVQSIPTVYAFSDGQPIDGFQGALPNSQVREFVEKVAGSAPGGLEDAVTAAEEMLEAGEIDDAAQTFAAIIEEDGNMASAYAGLAKCHIAKGDLDEAEAVLNGAPAEISTASEIEAVHAKIGLAREAANAGPADEFAAKLEANPDDHEARFDLAQALLAAEDNEGAVEQLLELFKRDRDWNDGAAKAQLFKIFDALEANDPVVLNGRRKLSSLILV